MRFDTRTVDCVVMIAGGRQCCPLQGGLTAPGTLKIEYTQVIYFSSWRSSKPWVSLGDMPEVATHHAARIEPLQCITTMKPEVYDLCIQYYCKLFSACLKNSKI
jgi:hypothetical protein